MAKKVGIKDLKHYVALCSGKDVVTSTGMPVLFREDVLRTYVKIEPKASSMFSREGFAIMEPRDKQTHLITMRMRRDIDIASSAWVYEERLQSGSRWFKVLGIKDDNEDGEFIILSAKIIEKGDDLTTPVEPKPATESVMAVVQHGVRL